LKGWEEARRYSQSFKTNEISGGLLTRLNVQTLRNELGIVKLGHRLEIIAAIEKNELTLINPTIVSVDLDMSFIYETSQKSSLQWNVNRDIAPLKAPSGNMARCSNKFKISSCANRRTLEHNLIPQSQILHPGLHLLCDSDRIFNGTVSKMKSKSIFRKSRVRNCAPIPHLQLPSSAVQSEENVVVEVVFGIWCNRRLSASSAKSEVHRATCEGNITCLQILSQITVEREGLSRQQRQLF